MSDLSPQVNIVVPDAGGSASDPLNVIPDEYEEYEEFGIEDYDQANTERDQNYPNLIVRCESGHFVKPYTNIFISRHPLCWNNIVNSFNQNSIY